MKEKEQNYKRGLTYDNLMSKAPNKFLLVNAAAGRARQIVDGSLPYVNDFDPTNPIITAFKEIASDKISIKALKEPLKKSSLLDKKEKEEKKLFALDSLEKKKKKKYK